MVPQQDPIKITEIEVASFSAAISGQKINSDEMLDYYGSVATRLKALVKELEADRKKITAPMNAALGEVNKRYKGPREAAEALISTINTEMSAYLDVRDRERKALQAQVNNDRIAQVNEAIEMLRSDDPILAEEAMDIIAAPAVIVDAPVAPSGVGVAMLWTWECTDFSAVPDEYKILDEPKLNGIARGTKGTERIPGINFKQVRSFRG